MCTNASRASSRASGGRFGCSRWSRMRRCSRGFNAPHETRMLDGDFRYKILVTFNSIDALDAARRHLRNVTGKAPNAPDAPYLVLADPVEQHLMLTGTTFFIGMDFADLRRLQLDIETYISPGFEFPSAAREGDRVIAISLTDSTGFERLLKGSEMDERAMLEEMVRVVQRARPRRGRGAQPVSLRPRIPRGARAAPSRAAQARARRRRVARAAVADADRRAIDRVPPLRHPGPQHYRHVDPRAALRHRRAASWRAWG